MRPKPLDLLQSTFGFRQFRGCQAEVIDELIAGRDAMVLMPTGGGKSLCYQIPALIRPGTGIVISPLIALMQDQVEALHQLGVKANYLNSSQSPDDQYRVERELAEGELDILYVAPERLTTPRFLNLLDRLALSLFAIDEAHCVSQWGHDFRSDYLNLSILHQRFAHVPRIALTATADLRTREEIALRLDLRLARRFITSFDRPNIRYTLLPKESPKQQLLRFLRQGRSEQAGIVYCQSRRKTEEIAAFLNASGFKALAYHAGLDAMARRENQRRFQLEEGLIMVATIAFGMGIDKPNVRFVAHLDLPRNPEAFYQESGRCGRDGQPAEAWMVYGVQDVVLHRQRIEESEANETFKRIERQRLDALLGICETTTCRRAPLLRYFGESLEGPCGNCDNCLTPPPTFDATEAAQMALSCAYRTGQSFGAQYLIDVLSGIANERITRQGHQRMSTFGIGKAHSSRVWRSIFRQLILRGHLAVDADQHGALKLTESCRALLRGEATLTLRADTPKTRDLRNGKSMGDSQLDQEGLFEALRQLRRDLAEAQGVPPYLIFQDVTLREITVHRPRTLEALGRISGIGQKKLERYGESVLELVMTEGA